MNSPKNDLDKYLKGKLDGTVPNSKTTFKNYCLRNLI